MSLRARRSPGGWIAQALAVVAAVASCSTSGRSVVGSPGGDSSVTDASGDGAVIAPARPLPAGRAVLDLLPLVRAGGFDAAGPIVDFGDPQQSAHVLPPLPISESTQQGDSWAAVGARVRARVPIDLGRPPTALRIRLRRVRARAVLALVDGVPARQTAIPPQAAGARAVNVAIPLAPERFRRDSAEVELRFLGVSRAAALAASRAAQAALAVRPRRGARGARRPAPVERPFDPHATRIRPGAQPRPAPALANAAVVAELDWLHLASDDTPPFRAGDLVGDVRIDGLPRRAAALYAPGRVAALTLLPLGAVLRVSLGADGVRGPDAVPVRARVLVESDGVPSVEHTEVVQSGAPWRDVALDLGALAGRVVRVSFAAEPATEPEPPPVSGAVPAPRRPAQTRLAVADPRIEYAAPRAMAQPEPSPPTVGATARHALFVVLRGLRTDRALPSPPSRFAPGSIARVAREGLALRAVAPSMRPVAALASTVTGLPAEVHGITEWTDTLADEAPTFASSLREAGVVTAGFSDDPWWIGSGLDRGFAEAGSCVPEGTNTTAACRAEGVLARAANFLVENADRRAFALVIARAGVPPFDPPPDVLATLDPTPPSNGITAEQTGSLALRSRRNPLSLEAPTTDRIAMLYDAALLGADRGLAQALERLREAGTLERTVVIVVGDRGAALGEEGLVGEGPYTLGVVSHTLLAMRGPGLRPLDPPQGAAIAPVEPVAGVLDAAATVLERMHVPLPDPLVRAGASSWALRGDGVVHPRGVVVSAGPRGEPGLRFADMLAVPRAGGALALYVSGEGGAHDVSAERPIARAFAETVLSQYRSGADAGESPAQRDAGEGGDAVARDLPRGPLRTWEPSTRALRDSVAATLRSAGALRR